MTPAVESPSSPGYAAGAGSSVPTAAQHAVERLVAAGVAGDRAAWDSSVVVLDAGFRDRSRLLFDNLAVLRPERLGVRLTGAALELPPARRAVLGSGARVLQARLTWRLPHERSDATATVWLTLVPGPDGERLAGTGDGPDLDSSPQPLWWAGPVTRSDRDRATVLAGAGQDADRWARLADRAASAVRSRLPAPARKGWDGRVVVEVPASAADLARVLGSTPSAYAGTAAVTRPEGPTTDAAVRVVVNPATASGTDDELGTLLTHETVHVVTRSAGSPAPLWMVEGLAEHVALRAHPDQRAAARAALRGVEPGAGGLPPDPAFAAGAPDVTAAYARAWLACGAVAEQRGEDGLARLYVALDEGTSLDRAARSALGVSGATVRRWARDEVRRAVRAERG